MKRDYDFCLPLFYFEHEYLITHGVKSLWCAHPLVHDMENLRTPDEFYERFGADKVIALMSGSRKYDINYHAEILLKTAEILREKNYRPVFSIARGLNSESANKLRELVKDFDIWENSGRDLMSGAEAVAGVSGTVAVEAMLLKKFMVVIYNMKKLTYWLLKKLVRVKKISIPNYLSGEPVYPELLCDRAAPENIVRELEKYLTNSDNQRAINLRLEKARALMGKDNAAEFWARSVKNEL